MCCVQIARTIIVTFVTIKIDLVKAETPDTDEIVVHILESRVSSFSAAYHGHTVRHYARASRGLTVQRITGTLLGITQGLHVG